MPKGEYIKKEDINPDKTSDERATTKILNLNDFVTHITFFYIQAKLLFNLRSNKLCYSLTDR